MPESGDALGVDDLPSTAADVPVVTDDSTADGGDGPDEHTAALVAVADRISTDNPALRPEHALYLAMQAVRTYPALRALGAGGRGPGRSGDGPITRWINEQAAKPIAPHVRNLVRQVSAPHEVGPEVGIGPARAVPKTRNEIMRDVLRRARDFGTRTLVDFGGDMVSTPARAEERRQERQRDEQARERARNDAEEEKVKERLRQMHTPPTPSEHHRPTENVPGQESLFDERGRPDRPTLWRPRATDSLFDEPTDRGRMRPHSPAPRPPAPQPPDFPDHHDPDDGPGPEPEPVDLREFDRPSHNEHGQGHLF